MRSRNPLSSGGQVGHAYDSRLPRPTPWIRTGPPVDSESAGGMGWPHEKPGLGADLRRVIPGRFSSAYGQTPADEVHGASRHCFSDEVLCDRPYDRLPSTCDLLDPQHLGCLEQVRARYFGILGQVRVAAEPQYGRWPPPRRRKPTRERPPRPNAQALALVADPTISPLRNVPEAPRAPSRIVVMRRPNRLDR